MNENKIKHYLAEKIKYLQPNEMLDVILELYLEPRSMNKVISRRGRIAELKEAFHHISEPVEQIIKEEGGNVVGRAWINQTIRAHVPVSTINYLCQLDEVMAVDAPHALHFEE